MVSVMITGGTGFVGLNLAEALLGRGETVVLYALDAVPEVAARVLAALPGRLVVERGDVRDAERLGEAMREHRVDRFFPFAAVTSGPQREADAPERVLEVNLLGFVSQLRAARDAGVRRVVAPSSSAVYGTSFYGADPVDEERTPPVPISLYGITKYAVERTALRLGQLWGLDVVAARIGAVFGPWERDTGVRDLLGPHWQILRHAVQGRTAVLPAVLPPYPWVYARDAASALLHLLDMPTPPQGQRVFNVCSGEAWGERILEWCERLAASMPGFTWMQSDDPAQINVRLTETRPRAPMSIRRLAGTGWTPRYPPATAYDDYLAWALAYPDAATA